MKKLDKLILQSFIGPFIITFLVAIFILLLVYMMKYFDDFIGKDLGISVFLELMGYFSINQIPMALPLAVLISSLMTYGKLGEHFELTAIKSAGISLIRVILPTFVFSILLAIAAFLLSDNVIPTANLRAFSLLYDIKQTKPSMDLREGQFYNGIPKYSIKITKKFDDDITMKGIVIYDHTSGNGNKKVIIADSCRMYSFMGGHYLKMNLFNGNYYIEEEKKGKQRSNKKYISQFVRTKFKAMDLIFSLSSFDLNSTDKELFADNRYMKGIAALTNSIDSMGREVVKSRYSVFQKVPSSYSLHLAGYVAPSDELIQLKQAADSIIMSRRQPKNDSIEIVSEKEKISSTMKVEKDTVKQKSGGSMMGKDQILKSKLIQPFKNKTDSSKSTKFPSNNKSSIYVNVDMANDGYEKRLKKKLNLDTLYLADDSVVAVLRAKVDSAYIERNGGREQVLSRAVSNARNIKTTLDGVVTRQGVLKRSIDSHVVEKYKKYAQAFACIAMFLIGAPLGAIIKKGGLGFPVIISIFFFILFYILTSVGDKWAKSGVMDGLYAAWMSNIVLLPIGLFFLKQARKDAKIFDSDFYNVKIDQLKTWWKAKYGKKTPSRIH